jgi:hypothetical protein
MVAWGEAGAFAEMRQRELVLKASTAVTTEQKMLGKKYWRNRLHTQLANPWVAVQDEVDLLAVNNHNKLRRDWPNWFSIYTRGFNRHSYVMPLDDQLVFLREIEAGRNPFRRGGIPP